MNSKMNIKSICIMAIISIVSMLFINISLAANTGTINVDVANVRETADASSKILEQIPLNQEVELVEEQGDWYKISHNGITGYLKKDLVNTSKETAENNASTTENTVEENSTQDNNTTNTENTQNTSEKTEIQLGEYKIQEDTKLKLIPSINATDVIELKKDESVKVVEIINGWASVETQTTKGWIRKDKLKSLEEIRKEQEEKEAQAKAAQEAQEKAQQEEVEKAKKAEEAKKQVQTTVKKQYVNSSTANVRRENNTTSDIISTITLNTEVQVYKTENGWSKVKVNNVEGYISASLLSDNKQETSRGQSVSRKTSSTNNQKVDTTESTVSVPASTNGTGIVSIAKTYLGYKYVYGGTSPSTGFDCSGFTSYIYKQYGISLNRTAAGQYGNGVAVSRANLQPGDLVMFGKSGINHVAIYIGGGQIIHASTPSTGVRIDSLSTGYYNNNYVGARRIR